MAGDEKQEQEGVAGADPFGVLVEKAGWTLLRQRLDLEGKGYSTPNGPLDGKLPLVAAPGSLPTMFGGAGRPMSQKAPVLSDGQPADFRGPKGEWHRGSLVVARVMVVEGSDAEAMPEGQLLGPVRHVALPDGREVDVQPELLVDEETGKQIHFVARMTVRPSKGQIDALVQKHGSIDNIPWGELRAPYRTLCFAIPLTEMIHVFTHMVTGDSCREESARNPKAAEEGRAAIEEGRGGAGGGDRDFLDALAEVLGSMGMKVEVERVGPLGGPGPSPSPDLPVS